MRYIDLTRIYFHFEIEQYPHNAIQWISVDARSCAQLYGICTDERLIIPVTAQQPLPGLVSSRHRFPHPLKSLFSVRLPLIAPLVVTAGGLIAAVPTTVRVADHCACDAAFERLEINRRWIGSVARDLRCPSEIFDHERHIVSGWSVNIEKLAVKDDQWMWSWCERMKE